MENLLITNENINYIGGIIKKIISRSKEKTLVSQNFYPYSKRFKINCNKIKYDKLIIENSVKHKVNIVNIDFRDLHGEKYININNGDDTNEFSWKAIVIQVGHKITIKNNIIFIIEINYHSKKIIKKIIIK